MSLKDQASVTNKENNMADTVDLAEITEYYDTPEVSVCSVMLLAW